MENEISQNIRVERNSMLKKICYYNQKPTYVENIFYCIEIKRNIIKRINFKFNPAVRSQKKKNRKISSFDQIIFDLKYLFNNNKTLPIRKIQYILQGLR